jgi:hypothetical protein
MSRLIPADPAIAHLVETNSKIGGYYGNKFLPVAIMLQCSSRPGWYNLLKMNRRSPAIDPQFAVARPGRTATL